jgi:glycosyltransferase involved in cell wall biosynthesis
VGANPRAPAPTVSVVIPVLNGTATLGQQLAALAGQTYRGPWEVVVADNGSTDNTADLVAAWAGRVPGLRLVDASARRSTNHARNVGAAAAGGRLLAFCDADDMATPGWLAGLVAGLEDHELVGGRLDELALNDPAVRAWRWDRDAAGLPRALRFLPYAVSANLAVRADVLAALGGWNEDFIRGGSEVELCWRAQLAGYRLGYVPEAVMRYRHRSTRRAFAYQQYEYGRAEVQLYRTFRRHGLPRQRVSRSCWAWAWTVVHLPDLWGSPAHQGRWLRRVAFRVGRLHGSIRLRALCL